MPAATTDFSPAVDDVRAAMPNVVGMFSETFRGDAGVMGMTSAGLGAFVEKEYPTTGAYIT